MNGPKTALVAALLIAVTGLWFLFHPVMFVQAINDRPSFQASLADLGVVFVPTQIEVLEISKDRYSKIMVQDEFHVIRADDLVRHSRSVIDHAWSIDDADVSFVSGMDLRQKSFMSLLHAIFSEDNLSTKGRIDCGGLSVVREMQIPQRLLSDIDSQIVGISLRQPHVRSLIFGELVQQRFLRRIELFFRRDLRLSKLFFGRSQSLLCETVGSVSFDRIANDSRNPQNFNKPHPPRRITIAACLGILAIGWGWWNLRGNKRLVWATCIFLFGIILWGWAANSFLAWSEHF